MKRCPSCNRNYTDDTLRFCLEDGTPLVQAPLDEPTITTPAAEPPPTLVYHAPLPPAPAARATAPVPPPPTVAAAWTPTALPPKRKRKVWPWVLGGFILLSLLGVGFIVLLIGLASLGSDNSNNSNSSNTNSNLSNANRVVNGNTANANSFGASPKPTPTNVDITKAFMAKDNGSGEPGDQTESFAPADHTVHCVIVLDHPAEGTQIRFDWIGVDAGEFQNSSLKKLDYTTKAPENKVHAHLTLPRDWPEGDYKVDIYLNDQLARTITYKIE
jgi:hypothetical protein